MPTRILREWDEGYRTQQDDMESLFYVVMYGCLRWLPLRRLSGLGRWLYHFFYETTPDVDGRDLGGTEKSIQQAMAGREILQKFEFENEWIRLFLGTGYKYLATAHISRNSHNSSVLWTADNLLELFTSVCGKLSTDDSTNSDRTEHDISDYFAARSYDDRPSTRTALLCGAIHFHADHGTAQRPSRQILEDAVDDMEDTNTQERNRRGKKRRRHEALDREADAKRSTKRAKSRLVQLENPSSYPCWRKRHALRPRRPEAGSFTSSQGTRRSVRLASKVSSVV